MWLRLLEEAVVTKIVITITSGKRDHKLVIRRDHGLRSI